jgi:hypothetical protein
MNNNFANTRFPSSAAINQHVKEAQFHQQIWYKNEITPSLHKASIWEKAAQFVIVLTARFSQKPSHSLSGLQVKNEPGFKTKSI